MAGWTPFKDDLTLSNGGDWIETFPVDGDPLPAGTTAMVVFRDREGNIVHSGECVVTGPEVKVRFESDDLIEFVRPSGRDWVMTVSVPNGSVRDDFVWRWGVVKWSPK